MKIKFCKRNTKTYDYCLLHWNSDGTSQRTNGNQKAVNTSTDKFVQLPYRVISQWIDI